MGRLITDWLQVVGGTEEEDGGRLMDFDFANESALFSTIRTNVPAVIVCLQYLKGRG